MLPNIIKIAEEHGLAINPKSYGKKETMCICPFCNSGKYHLSINEEKNIFKCWHCKKSGGVLQFESLLTNKPFDEIREKYFGKKKAKKHPAYELSPDQLKQIGWHDKKQSSFNVFSKSKEEVLRDWKKYEYEEFVKHYALFILIKNFPFKELQKEQYQWYLKEIKKSKVENLNEKIIYSYKNKIQNHWVEKAEQIAKIAYKTCLETNDENFMNLYSNVIFAIELLKSKKKAN